MGGGGGGGEGGGRGKEDEEEKLGGGGGEGWGRARGNIVNHLWGLGFIYVLLSSLFFFRQRHRRHPCHDRL